MILDYCMVVCDLFLLLQKIKNMPVYYKISLTPLAPFFFGKDAISELGNKQNYFQTSAFLPPQTTLLGMLRHHLLMKKGWAFPQVESSTAEDLENLIGQKGFVPYTLNNYGVIQRLSPVFLTKNNAEHYFLCNKLFVKGTEVSSESSTGKAFGSTEDSKANHILKLNGNKLTAKDLFDDCFVNYKNINDKIEFNNVISQVLQTGNTKTAYRKEMSDDEAYYRFNHASFVQHSDIKEEKEEKRTYKRKNVNTPSFILNDIYKFSFYAELQNEELEDQYSNVIIMGKEQSPFQMDIAKLPFIENVQEIPILFQKPEINAINKRVWLLSNLFSEESNELKANTNFICTESAPFRCFTKSVHHDQRAKKWSFSKPNKTTEYSLYKQGGILYSDKISELKDSVFDKAPEWQKIGYNYFKTI